MSDQNEGWLSTEEVVNEILEAEKREWAEERLRPLNNKALDDLNSGTWSGAALNYAQGVQDAMRALGVEP